MNSVVLDIGGTKCSIAESNQLESRYQISTADYATPSEILSELGNWASSKKFDSMGVSFGGPFNFQTQTVRRSVHVTGWEGFSFADWAMREFGVAATADNDGNAGALGEHAARHKSIDSMVYVTISTGIGAGVIIDGRLYRGKSNLSGELGHVVIDPAGPPDQLGNFGTLERLCSGFWIERDFGRPASELLQDDKFLTGYAKNLAGGLEVVVRLLNPELIVLGGGITKTGTRLENLLLDNMSRLLLDSGTKVEFSTLGNLNVLLGAKELAKP